MSQVLNKAPDALLGHMNVAAGYIHEAQENADLGNDIPCPSQEVLDSVSWMVNWSHDVLMDRINQARLDEVKGAKAE